MTTALANKPAALTREALLHELRSKPQECVRSIERAAVNEDRRTVELAFASETPYERWWGVEVLEVSKKAVRMGRIVDGAPLLADHNSRDQIGVIESVSLGADKVLRATVRFSRSARGEEMFRDVVDGIRQKVSVGYLVHDMVLIEQKDDINTYRVTDWEPMEVSLVSIPADNSVGVGRSATLARVEETMSETQNPAQAGPETQVHAHLEATRAAEAAAHAAVLTRMREIKDIARNYAHVYAKSTELADTAVLDPAMTADRFRGMLLEAIRQARPAPTQIGAPTADDFRQGGGMSFGEGGREIISYGTLRAFVGASKRVGGRRSDEEVAYRAGMWARAVIHGNADAMRWCRDAGVMVQQVGAEAAQRTMTEGVFTSAGWLVPVEMEAGIIANREQYGVARRVVRIVPMSSADTSIPRVTSDIEAYFVGEGNDGTASDSAGDQVNLALKDLMAYSKIGKSTAQDTAIPLAEFVAEEQGRAFGIKEDKCWLLGDGTSTYGGMQGIITLLENASYTGGRVVASTNVDTFGEITTTDTSAVLGLLPVYARPGARWLCSGIAEALVFGRIKAGAGGNDVRTLREGIIESDYAGFPVTVAHHMPSGAATDYTSKVMLLLGNFQLGTAMGVGQGMTMTVDPYTLAHNNLTRLISTERIDIVNHGVNKSTTVAGPIVALHGA